MAGWEGTLDRWLRAVRLRVLQFSFSPVPSACLPCVQFNRTGRRVAKDFKLEEPRGPLQADHNRV